MNLKLDTIFIIKYKLLVKLLKKKAYNTCIRINTFKIKHNFYHKNIEN